MSAPGRGAGVVIALYACYGLGSVAGLLVLRAVMPTFVAEWSERDVEASTVAQLLLGIALYGCSFCVWLAILARMPVASAYGIGIGITMVLTALGGALVLGERVTLRQLIGIIGVTVCVALIASDLSVDSRVGPG